MNMNFHKRGFRGKAFVVTGSVGLCIAFVTIAIMSVLSTLSINPFMPEREPAKANTGIWHAITNVTDLHNIGRGSANSITGVAMTQVDNYSIVNDIIINAAEYSTWNPTTIQFSGTIDGRFNTIRIIGEVRADVGIFARMNNAEVRDLNIVLDGTNIASRLVSNETHFGALVGVANNSVIRNVRVDGIGSAYVMNGNGENLGGIVGRATYTNLINCSVENVMIRDGITLGVNDSYPVLELFMVLFATSAIIVSILLIIFGIQEMYLLSRYKIMKKSRKPVKESQG